MAELDELQRAAEQQGWRLDPTTDGVMFYPPDKTKSGVLVHRKPTEQALKKDPVDASPSRSRLAMAAEGVMMRVEQLEHHDRG